jgi:DNA-binding SARP family transcriptional activator
MERRKDQHGTVQFAPHDYCRLRTRPNDKGALWIASGGLEVGESIMICVLGNIQLLHEGQLLPVRPGGKSEALVSYLAIMYSRPVSRKQLTQALWPTSDPALASHSLNNLVYTLNKRLGPRLSGSALVLHEEGYYRLNTDVGIVVDVERFDRLTQAGDRQTLAGDTEAASVSS